MLLPLSADIDVKSNLKLTMRERGKIIARREGHNIWLNTGREYLARRIAFLSFNPDVPEETQGVKYMGLGIGGNRQIAPDTANNPPISPPYSGTNAQDDTDATLLALERPVRISGSSSAYPGLAGDVWLGQIQAPAGHPIATETVFTRVFSQLEVSYAPFLSVPLSEVGLFLSGADPENYQNTMIAYDTFDTLSKTVAFELEVVWTLKFG